MLVRYSAKRCIALLCSVFSCAVRTIVVGYGAVQFDAAWHGAVCCCEVRLIMVRCIGMQNSLGRCSAMRCNEVRRGTLCCIALHFGAYSCAVRSIAVGYDVV